MSDLAIWYPIGVLDEIDAMGLPRKTTASCSLQTSDNRGCPWFRTCRFRAIRDGAQPPGHDRPLKGPENISVYVQIPKSQGGAADIKFMSCEMYYQSGLHQRWRHMMTGEGDFGAIKVLGIAGDGKDYIIKEHVKAHRVKDPNCPDCASNTCIRMVLATQPDGKPIRRPIPRFPRPHESLQDIALGEEIGKQVRAEVEREMEREALGVGTLDDETEAEAQVIGAGIGKAGRKS